MHLKILREMIVMEIFFSGKTFFHFPQGSFSNFLCANNDNVVVDTFRCMIFNIVQRNVIFSVFIMKSGQFVD